MKGCIYVDIAYFEIIAFEEHYLADNYFQHKLDEIYWVVAYYMMEDYEECHLEIVVHLEEYMTRMVPASN